MPILWFNPYLKAVAAPSLYNMAFPFTFTTLNGSGPSAPTSLSYSSIPGNGTSYVLTLTNGQQYWTVPQTRAYTFTVAGAGLPSFTSIRTGGTMSASYGMVVNATITLTKGTVIAILCGQQGLQCPSGGLSPGNFGQGTMGGAFGGCGGTFVVAPGNVPLIVAGGAGGAGQAQSSGDSGQSGTSGSGPAGYAGGTGGNGGVSGSVNSSFGAYVEAAGGGFYSAGGVPTYGSMTGGQSYVSGGAGGSFGGGFGCGGGVGGQGMGGGGGGGYSGGGAGGTLGTGAGGGGGGSYVTGTTNPYNPIVNSYNATNTGQGYVIIT